MGAMRIIAQTSRTVTWAILILLTPTFLRAVIDPSVWSIGWVAIGLSILSRVSQIKLAVSPEHVTVLNFFSTTHIPIWEAEVEVEDLEGGLLLSDLGGKFDRGGRQLVVVQSWPDRNRVHVGAAPRYGSEVERIHDDLVSEIERQRAA